MEGIIYRAFSFFSFVGSFLTRIIFFVLIFYLFAHRSENPVLIFILIIIIFALMLFVGDDQIILSNSELIFTDSSIMVWILGFGKRKYKLEEIRSVYMQSPNDGPLEIGIAAALAVFLPKHINSRTIPLFIEFKDGNTIRKETNGLSRNQLKKLEDAVNSLIDRQSKKG